MNRSMKDGLWLMVDGEECFYFYDELEQEIIDQLIQPIGGFVFAANQFTHMNLPRVPFYIDDWLPKQGKMLLYGPAKTGKSYLSIQMARCIGIGEPFLGIPTQRGKTLYTQFELGEEILMKRMIETNKDYDNVYVGTRLNMKLDRDSGQADFNRAMEAVQPAVLIVDPLYKTMEGDENEATDVMRILNYLDQLIEAYHCSIVLIHHAGKDITKRGRGSSVLEDWVDSYIQIKPDRKTNNELVIKLEPQFLRHAALPEEPITARLENYEFAPVGVPSNHDKLLAYIKTNQETTIADLLDTKIAGRSAIYEGLKELETAGLISRIGRGKYRYNEPTCAG